MNISNEFSLHSDHSGFILCICFIVYGIMDTMFPPLLISGISEFSVLGDTLSIVRDSCSSLIPWTPVQSYLWPLIKLISVFASLLYIPSTIAFIFCACFLPVVLILCPSNPSVCSAWNFNLVLFLLSPWMQLWHPYDTALLYCLSLWL